MFAPAAADPNNNNNIEQQPDDEYPFDDPKGMILTPAELERALDIKEAVEEDSELLNLKTDFEYVQYAIALKSLTISEIKHRIYLMQCFYEEYNIQDNVEEGIDFFRNFTTYQQPGNWLSIDYLPSSGNYVAIKDFASYYPARAIATNQSWRTILGATYYRMHCMCTNFHSIREGISLVFECDGYGWSNFDPAVDEQGIATLFGVYPQHHKEMLFVNTPTWINVAYALWKRLLHPDQYKTIQMGVQLPGYEGRRIDQLFKQPTLEVARDNMIERVRTYLEARYKNQREFSFTKASASTATATATAASNQRRARGQQQQQQQQPLE